MTINDSHANILSVFNQQHTLKGKRREQNYEGRNKKNRKWCGEESRSFG